MTSTEVKKLLLAIDATYPNFNVKDPETTARVWSDLLADQDATAIFGAFKTYARTDKSGFAPSPGKLIQAAYELTHKDETDVNESEAWAMVVRAVHRGIDNSEADFNAFPPAVKRAVGTAAQIRRWALSEDFNEGVESSNFKRAYRAAVEQEKNNALVSADVKALAQGMTARLEG